MTWYEKAADHGHAESMCMIGGIYFSGRCVKKDYAEALSWYRKAAQLGDPQAMINGGNMYRLGRGVKQDAQEAYRWFQRGAYKGSAGAQRAANEMESVLTKEQISGVHRELDLE